MKKLMLLSLILFVSLLGACTNQNDPESLDVVVPAGSPQFSQLYLQGNADAYDAFSLNVDTIQGAATLPSAFGSESHDIIFAPTNLGAKLIDTGVPYQFAAAVTHGNLYLVTRNPMESMDDFDGKDITLFGQNATPDIILKTLMDNASYDESPSLKYVDSVQSALAEFKTGQSDIVMLAEPMLSTLERDEDDLHVFDLQDAWDKAFDKDSYPQAGIFIHNSVDENTTQAYLSALEESIKMANEDPDTVATLAESLGVPFDKNVLIDAIPRSHLKFVHAQDAKEDLEFYFGKIMELNPDLINDTLPQASFYYALNEE